MTKNSNKSTVSSSYLSDSDSDQSYDPNNSEANESDSNNSDNNLSEDNDNSEDPENQVEAAPEPKNREPNYDSLHSNPLKKITPQKVTTVTTTHHSKIT